jgi:hypothetical protein
MNRAHPSAHISTVVVAPELPVQFSRDGPGSWVGRAVVALFAAGSVLLGCTVALVSLVIAAISFDGATLFGC